MKRVGGRFWMLWALLSITACSRYALRDYSNELQAPVEIELPETIDRAQQRLHKYLVSRGRFENLVTNSSGKFIFVQPWVRDSSLRYYLLEYDTRYRHLSEWKAQWTLTEAGPFKTKLQLRVLEVIFLGPPDTLGARPRITRGSGREFIFADWVETDRDDLRASLEARRFWIEHYPRHPLPAPLAGFTQLTLEGPPRSIQSLERRWTPLARPRAF